MEQYLTLASGNWLGTGTLNADDEKVNLEKGDVFTYLLEIVPVKEAKSAVYKGEFGVAEKNFTNQVRGLAGWDPVRQHVTLTVFWGKRGSVEKLFLTRCDDNKLYGADTHHRRRERPSNPLSCSTIRHQIRASSSSLLGPTRTKFSRRGNV